MTTYTKSASEALNAIVSTMQAEFGDHIRSVASENDEPEYLEVAIEVGAETRDAAATVAVKSMAPTIRNHGRFDEESHAETVVPTGETNDEVRYTVYVRERL